MLELEFDQFTAVEASLLLLETCVESFDRSPAFYKGAIQQTYNALYGACVCHLTNSAGLGALKPNNERQALAALNQGSRRAEAKAKKLPFVEQPLTLPEPYMMNLRELLQALPLPIGFSLAKDFSPNLGQREIAVYQLIEYRDRFEHFPPATWWVNVDRLASVIRECCKLVQQVIVSDAFSNRNRFYETTAAEVLSRICQKLDRGS